MSLCLMITFHTVNVKCIEECWMLCDDRLNTHVSSDGQRTTLLGYLPMVEASTDRWTSKVELSVDHQMIHVCSSEYRWLRIQRYGRITNLYLYNHKCTWKQFVILPNTYPMGIGVDPKRSVGNRFTRTQSKARLEFGTPKDIP